MFFIAWRNLLKEPTRLALTLVGVTFAVVLMLFDVGAYLGFVRAASVLIDNADADIWVTLENNRNFDSSRPFSERKLWKVKQVRGVAWAEPVAKGWAQTKLKSGSTEMVMLVGFDPDAGVGMPWRLREGSVRDLRRNDTVIIDESALGKLEGLAVGDDVEIQDTMVKVVGICEDVKSFTTYPIVFANYETAKRLSGVYRNTRGDQTNFVLVRVAPDATVDEVVARLQMIPGVDVYSREAFSMKTRRYWIVQTGMGVGFGITAILGFLVGMVIVGQTIYSSTLEHLREFGTLKALGATNRDIVAIIGYQAVLHAIMGYVVGLSIAMLARRGYEQLGLRLVTGTTIEIIMFGVTVAMCLAASIISIRSALRVDPAIVFRG